MIALALLALTLSGAPDAGRTLVLPLRSDGETGALARALTEVLEDQIRRLVPDRKVLGVDELRAMEAAQARAARIGSADRHALEAIGRAANAGEVIEGSLRAVGRDYLLDVRRLDVHGASVLHEAQRVLPAGRTEPLLAAVRRAADELYPNATVAPAREDEARGSNGGSNLFERAAQAAMEKAPAEDLLWRQDLLLGSLWSLRSTDRGLDERLAAQTGGPLVDATQNGWRPTPEELLGSGLTGYLASPEEVLARATALLWQRQAPAQRLTWDEALAYCRGLRLGGATGWRLPDGAELLTIVVAAKEPTIDGRVFPGTQLAWYWTGALVGGYAKAVSFISGGAYLSRTNAHNLVRCVRASSALPDPYE